MAGTMYGYICLECDSRGENWHRQALQDFGVADQRIYYDSDIFARKAYQTMLGKLQPGDAVVIIDASELGLTQENVQKEWRTIREEKQAHIVVLGEPAIDTRTNNAVRGTMYADIALAVIASLLHTEERLTTREQDAMRLAKARLKGNRPGRSPLARPAELDILREQWQSGTLSARGAAKLLGVSHHTALKWLRG